MKNPSISHWRSFWKLFPNTWLLFPRCSVHSNSDGFVDMSYPELSGVLFEQGHGDSIKRSRRGLPSQSVGTEKFY